jgi:Icc-related predicted phosphoesterase
MIKIAHFSDNHGGFGVMQMIRRMKDIDLIVCSGDFFPNGSRGEPDVEIPFQTKWFYNNLPQIKNVLGSEVPFLFVKGNHDFVDLAELLRDNGYINAHSITTEGVELFGKRFSGYGNIPLIQGEWNGESTATELAGLTFDTLESQPDILVVHAPPCGILDHAGYGNRALSSALAYNAHNITHAMFGHSHEGRGTTEEMGIFFSNAATTLNILTIP